MPTWNRLVGREKEGIDPSLNVIRENNSMHTHNILIINTK